jgi:hypothetical protein
MPCNIFGNLQLWFANLSRIPFTLKYKHVYVLLAYDLRCGSTRPGNRRANMCAARIRLIGWGFPVLMEALVRLQEALTRCADRTGALGLLYLPVLTLNYNTSYADVCISLCKYSLRILRESGPRSCPRAHNYPVPRRHYKNTPTPPGIRF